MSYLLDTNALSDILRAPDGNTARRLFAVDEDKVFTSVIVAYELRYGAIKKGSTRLNQAVATLLETIRQEPLTSETGVTCAELRATQEKAGKPLAALDTLIAAHALSLDAILVTDDLAFSMVPGLKTENWLR